jgi:hypothetical protein
MSGRLLLNLLGGAAAILALLLLWEALSPNAEEATVPSPAAAAHDQAAAAGRPAPVGAEITRWVNAILARPLFSVTRKPDATASNAGPAAADEHQDLPRLSGILSVGNTRHAMFQPSGDVPTLVVGEGELVAGWNVTKIGLDSVTLKGPNGETTVEPKFDENLTPPAPPSPVYTKPANPVPPRSNVPQQPGQPQPAVPANIRGGPPVNGPGMAARPLPGQPTAVPTRPPFIPQQRTASPGGVQQQPGVR